MIKKLCVVEGAPSIRMHYVRPACIGCRPSQFPRHYILH